MKTSALFTFILFANLYGWQSFMNPKELGFPHASDLTDWELNNNYAQNEAAPDPHSLEKKTFSCKSNRVWPTHPGQETKDYIYAVSASYRSQKLSDANAIVMSDFFSDECGNTYKGYWIVSFLSREETMETLVSRGRTIIKRPGGYPGEYIPSSTFSLVDTNFLFFSPVNPEDQWKIELSQERARAEGYILKDYQWIRSN